MYLSTTVIAVAVIAISLTFAILLHAAHTHSHRRGYQQARNELDGLIADKNQLIEDLNDRNHHDRSMFQRARADAATAMEHLEHEHNEAIALLRNDLEKAHIQTMRKVLTDTEMQLLDDMSQKLRLSSNALHATQQYADSKQANLLAKRAQTLLKRLRPEPEALEDAA